LEEPVIKAAAAQGVWALLAVALLFYVLRENSKREANYQSIIQNLSQRFEGIEDGLKDLNNKFEHWIKGK
jgi:predicted PurR-regulated permease PerM